MGSLLIDLPAMPSISVSIVIPTFNRASLLRDSVASALNQSYSPIEVIVVDDGSTDSTREVLRSLEQNILTLSLSHVGTGAARNAGLAKSKGLLIAFLDDDDWLERESVAKRVDCLLAHPDCGVVYSDLYVTNESGRILGRYSQERKAGMPSGDIYEALLPRNFIPIHAPLWRRSVLEVVGGFPHRQVSEDWECLMKAAEITRFQYLDEPLGYYRIHRSNITYNRAAMVNGYGVVQARNVASPRFTSLSQETKSAVLTRYAAQQWLQGDQQLGKEFSKMAWRVAPWNARTVALWILFLLGRRLGRGLFNSLWWFQARIRAAITATDQFRQSRPWPDGAEAQ